MIISKLNKAVRRIIITGFITSITLCAVAAACFLYARFIEPTWLNIQTIKLSPTPTITLIHISDTHYKGDRKYLERVVKTINSLDADFVCFTGDLVEDKKQIAPCMQILTKINKPLYGVPGNHDQWARLSNTYLAEQFKKTGGQWLWDGASTIWSNKAVIVGDLQSASHPIPPGTPKKLKRILLYHYPRIVDYLPPNSFNLILAGHTHGGQVNIPLIPNPILQPQDLAYRVGIFHTRSGTLHVSSGIGTYYWPIRFLCRPQITVIKL